MDQRRAIIVVCLTLFSQTPTPAWAWSPDNQDQVYTQECHPQIFSWRFLAAKSPEERQRILSKWLEQCDQKFREDRPQGEQAQDQFDKLEGAAYDLAPFEFADRKGFMHFGWALTKSTKSPAILMECDWSCDPQDDPWLRQVIMQLYEEGPYQIFLIESPQSKLAERWLAGGFESGAALLETGWWIGTTSPFRGKITSLHLLGRGATAGSSLYAHWMNDLNPIADDRKVFQGAVHFCPAVKLESVLTMVQNPVTDSQRNYKELWLNHLLRLRERYSFWQQQPVERNTFGRLWLEASFSLKSIFALNLNPFHQIPPRSTADWLQMGDFAYQGLHIKTPGWAVGSLGDPLYPYEKHFAELEAQHRDSRKSSLFTQTIADSSHCAYAVSMGWATSGALLRALMLGESYEIWPRQSLEDLAWEEPSPILNPGEIHLEQNWQLHDNGRLTLTYIVGKKDNPSTQREMSQEVALTSLPKELRPTIQNFQNLKAWNRQANVRLRLMGRSGPLLESNEQPDHLTWWKW